jgi:hypothetical protein
MQAPRLQACPSMMRENRQLTVCRMCWSEANIRCSWGSGGREVGGKLQPAGGDRQPPVCNRGLWFHLTLF